MGVRRGFLVSLKQQLTCDIVEEVMARRTNGPQKLSPGRRGRDLCPSMARYDTVSY
jgi:hypothetical protein